MDEQRLWTGLIRESAEAEPFLPEAPGELTALMRDLRTLDESGSGSDRRLLGLDLDNLMTSVRGIVTLRRGGRDPERLDDAVRDALRLMRSMQVRAVAALARKADTLAVHASVAAMGCGAAPEPVDVTRDFRLLAPAPACERPDALRLVASGFGGAESMGRLIGKHKILRGVAGCNTAPPGSVILPAGHELRFAAGEMVLLHTNGVVMAHEPDAPSETSFRTLMIEAGADDIILTGPAVLSPSSLPAGVISAAKDHADNAEILNGVRTNRNISLGTTAFSAVIGSLTMFSIMDLVKNYSPDQSIEQTIGLGITIGFGVVSAFGALLAVHHGEKTVRLRKIIKARDLHAPYLALKRALSSALERSPDHDACAMLMSAKPADAGGFGDGILPSILGALKSSDNDGLWFVPATHIRADPKIGVPVLEPLAAIPPPSGSEVMTPPAPAAVPALRSVA